MAICMPYTSGTAQGAGAFDKLPTGMLERLIWLSTGIASKFV